VLNCVKSTIEDYTRAAQREVPCRRGVYLSGTVCAAQMDVNFCQSGSTVLLWPSRASILFTSDRYLLPVFRSRANLVELQIRMWVVVGCHLLAAEEIAHARSAFCRWITGSWRHLMTILGGHRAIAPCANFTMIQNHSIKNGQEINTYATGPHGRGNI